MPNPRPWYRLDGHLGALLGRHQAERWHPRQAFRRVTVETMAPGFYIEEAAKSGSQEQEWATVYFLRHQLNLFQVG